MFILHVCRWYYTKRDVYTSRESVDLSFSFYFTWTNVFEKTPFTSPRKREPISERFFETIFPRGVSSSLQTLGPYVGNHFVRDAGRDNAWNGSLYLSRISFRRIRRARLSSIAIQLRSRQTFSSGVWKKCFRPITFHIRTNTVTTVSRFTFRLLLSSTRCEIEKEKFVVISRSGTLSGRIPIIGNRSIHTYIYIARSALPILVHPRYVINTQRGKKIVASPPGGRGSRESTRGV